MSDISGVNGIDQVEKEGRGLLLARLRLAQTIYAWLSLCVESFEDDPELAADATYLLGAIVTEGFCYWPGNRRVLALLRQRFPQESPIWRYARAE